mmetsp:Transcript_89980/g.160158  ORF Transcript_89980/g.160158 Transcript_89980/m.160158 type:complete len:229 (-) Transcript_89980:359-1045(-)
MSWQRIDTMLPPYVHITAEEEKHTIRLREVKQLSLPSALCTSKSKLAGSTKGDAHGAVLALGTLPVEGCRIVMERFPVSTISIPVEASATCARSYREVFAHSLQNPLVSLRSFRPFTEEMCSLMPRLEGGLRLPLRPKLPKLFDEIVVDLPVILGAKELWHHYHIIVANLLSIILLSWGSKCNTHGWAHQRRCWVERSAVASTKPSLPEACSLSLAQLCTHLTSWIII